MFVLSHLPFYITILLLSEPYGSWAEQKQLQRLRSSLHNTADSLVDTLNLFLVKTDDHQKPVDEVQGRFNYMPMENNPGLWAQLMGMLQNFNQYRPNGWWWSNSGYPNRRSEVESEGYSQGISSQSPRMRARVKSMRVLNPENFVPPPVERV